MSTHTLIVSDPSVSSTPFNGVYSKTELLENGNFLCNEKGTIGWMGSNNGYGECGKMVLYVNTPDITTKKENWVLRKTLRENTNDVLSPIYCVNQTTGDLLIMAHRVHDETGIHLFTSFGIVSYNELTGKTKQRWYHRNSSNSTNWPRIDGRYIACRFGENVNGNQVVIFISDLRITSVKIKKNKIIHLDTRMIRSIMEQDEESSEPSFIINDNTIVYATLPMHERIDGGSGSCDGDVDGDSDDDGSSCGSIDDDDDDDDDRFEVPEYDPKDSSNRLELSLQDYKHELAVEKGLANEDDHLQYSIICQGLSPSDGVLWVKETDHPVEPVYYSKRFLVVSSNPTTYIVYYNNMLDGYEWNHSIKITVARSDFLHCFSQEAGLCLTWISHKDKLLHTKLVVADATSGGHDLRVINCPSTDHKLVGTNIGLQYINPTGKFAIVKYGNTLKFVDNTFDFKTVLELPTNKRKFSQVENIDDN